MEKVTTEYERKIHELSEKIREYEAQIYQYKVLLEDKDYHINLLYKETQELKAQIQNLQQPVTPSPTYTPQLHPPPDSNQSDQLTPIPTMQTSTTSTPTTLTPTTPTPRAISTIMKRQCPNCGAYGFAIKEIDDKERLLSYIPRRIYAKKKHCTKCGYEF